MIEKIRTFIEKERLLDKDKTYLVAVSGGADSVCLLLVLLRLGYHVEAVHCNFHLRGEESDRDEEFVKNLCKRINIKLHLTHFDTKTYAQLHQVGIEMAARHLRYTYFEDLREAIGADGICVAHHCDDSVETVLMNLLRGTGIHGLQGIQPLRDHIIRPLLCVSREDIEKWLHEQKQDYVTDSTNLKPDNARNFLRLTVVPQLRQNAPTAPKNLLLTARRVTEAARIYDHYISEALKRLVDDDSLAIAPLLHEPSPESILFEWLHPKGFPSAVIEQISQQTEDLQPGRTWHSATHAVAVSQDNRLVLRPIEPELPRLTIPETGTYVYRQDEQFRVSLQEGREIIRSPYVCCLDATTVKFPLTIRPIQRGDRFCPLGMEGSKLVSDYLCDRKLSVLDRQRQLAVTDASDRIVWLVGQRADHRFRITDSTTAAIIIEHIG